MDIKNLKHWIELTQQFQSNQFLEQVLSEKNNNYDVSKTPIKHQEVFPRCDLYEHDTILVIEVEIPGLKKEDLEIIIQQPSLTIHGEFSTLEPKRQYFLKERPNRKFVRRISLPYPICQQKVWKEFKDGLLLIFLPIDFQNS